MNFQRFFFGPLRDAATEGGEGGGGSTQATQTQAAASITLDQVNDIVNRALANAKRDWQKTQAQQQQTQAQTTSQSTQQTTQSTSGGQDGSLADKALSRQLDEMRQQMDALKQESERNKLLAEAKDLDSTVRSELSKFEFAKPGAAEDLFSVLRSRIKKTEEGIFSEDGFSLSEYIKKAYDDRPWLAPAKQVGGSGAQGGSRSKGGVDVESIKPGMSADQRTAAWAELARVMGK